LLDVGQWISVTWLHWKSL